MPEREIITFDVPGVGQSAAADAAVPAARHRAARRARCSTATAIAQVDVLGVSWGGAAAQQFARSFAPRCRRLILCATAPGVVMVPAARGAAEDGDAAALHEPRLRALRSAATSTAATSARDPALAAEFFKHVQLAVAARLLPAARRRLRAGPASTGCPPAPADAAHGRPPTTRWCRWSTRKLMHLLIPRSRAARCSTAGTCSW